MDARDRGAEVASLAGLHAEIAACRTCAAAGYFAHASPIVVSQAPDLDAAAAQRLMLVGQAPASPLRSKGRPFSGQAGRVLFSWLARAGFSEEEFRARCYFTAITKCYPGPAGTAPAAGKGDRVPTAAERALCEPFLLRELALIRPTLIVTVGRISAAYFLGKDIDFTSAIGQVFERDGRKLLPLPHPSGVSRWTNAPENRARLDCALEQLRSLTEVPAHDRG